MISAQPPASITAGADFGLSVAVEDTYGNPEPTYNGNVSIALTGGNGLGGTLTVPATNGIASFSGLTLDQASSDYGLKASATGLTSATTSNFQITPAAASQLVIVAEPPANLIAGKPFGFSVEAEDPYGNVATGFKGTVTAVMSTSSTNSSRLMGTLTVTVNQGLANFSGLTIDQAGAGYTLHANAGNLASSVTSPLSISAASPTQLVVTTQPAADISAGSEFGISVVAEDAFGNVATTFQGPVTASLADITNAGSLGGNATVTAVNGVANFSGLVLNAAAVDDALQLTSGALSSTSTNPFEVTPAAPVRWVLVSQPPAKIPARQSIRIVAAIEDAFGNVVSDYDGTATVAIASARRNAGSHGLVTVPANSGVAVFDGTMPKKPGAGYTLSITGNGLAPLTSTPFKITSPHPAAAVFSNQLRLSRLSNIKPRPHSTQPIN